MEEIQFNEQEHRYYDGSKIEYTSVTTLIGKYANTYDTDFWAMYTALKEHNYTVKPVPEKRSIWCRNVLYKLQDLYKDDLFVLWVEEVKARWKVISGEACFRGNLIHNDLEANIDKSKQDFTKETNLNIRVGADRCLKTEHDLDKTDLREKYPIVYERLKGYINLGFSIYAEKRVHLPEFGVAGMIDVPLIHGKHFAILDWKTNKEKIRFEAGYYIKDNLANYTGTWRPLPKAKLLYPLSHLPKSNGSIYGLQLNTYAYLVELAGLPVTYLEIFHIRTKEQIKIVELRDIEEEIEVVNIEIPNMRSDVQIMLAKHYVTNVKNKATYQAKLL